MPHDMDDYKVSKEKFVSDLSGSSIAHVNLLSSAALATIALYYALSTRFAFWQNKSFTSAWIVLVLPLLLSMTVFAERPGLFTAILAVPACFISILPPIPSNGVASLPSDATITSPSKTQSTRIPRMPALTTYRAHMLLMTTLAILAVDFPIFPRILAKCESFGVSLMDIGVGSFVFAQGIVSAIPLLKNPGYLTSSFFPKMATILKKMIPIILLGLIRVALVKGTDYPEHESEYGRHWNFFITLAVLPIIEVAFHPILLHFPIETIGVALAVVQQVLLSCYGLQGYVLSAERNNLVSANKEGIVSLLGYFAIHLLGLSLGTKILPPTPSYFKHLQRQLRARVLGRTSSEKDKEKAKNLSLSNKRQADKTFTELCSYSVVWWTALYAVKYFDIDVSRRMVNLPYILWTVAYNTTFLAGYTLLDLLYFPEGSQIGLQDGADTSQKDTLPPGPLLSSINKNGLAVFLLANVATGLVNLSMQTMYTSDFWALVVLSIYAYAVCAVAWIFRNGRLLPI